MYKYHMYSSLTTSAVQLQYKDAIPMVVVDDNVSQGLTQIKTMGSAWLTTSNHQCVPHTHYCTHTHTHTHIHALGDSYSLQIARSVWFIYRVLTVTTTNHTVRKSPVTFKWLLMIIDCTVQNLPTF